MTRPNFVFTESLGDSCADNNNNCNYWSNVGECSRNPGYMLHHCKKSCGLCTGKWEDCATMKCPEWYEGGCFWNDVSCSLKYRPICGKKEPSINNISSEGGRGLRNRQFSTVSKK